MAEHGAKVQTFTVGYHGAAAGFNELKYARQVAQHVGTQHHELVIAPAANIALLPQVLWQFDEPLGEPTSVLVNILCRFARQRVKVALGGTGGDEIFFGYPRYAGLRLLDRYRRLPRILRNHALEPLLACWPESTRGSRLARRVRRFISAGERPADEAYLAWTSLIPADTRAGLLSDKLRDAVGPAEGDAFMRDILVLPATHAELLNRAAELDVRHYLPEFQLTYMDRMSMAHGLEVRSPFCDYHLVDFVLSLPAAYRLKGTRGKHILKTAARQWLPQSIIERRKVGFDSPVGQWFKDELREFMLRFLAREQVARSGLLNPASVERLLGEHLSGQRDYSLQLWSVLVLEAWYRMYIEDGVSDASTCQLRSLRGAVDSTARHSRHIPDVADALQPSSP